MPITSVSPKLAKAINKMVAVLKEDYGTNYSYSINGRGMTLAQANEYGVNHPTPIVHPKKSK